VKGEVLEIDRFGNVRLNLRPGHLERAGLSDDSELQVTTPNATAAVRRIARRSRPCGRPGEPAGAAHR
jgi:S-adenosylmethionine hydrolase